MQLIDGWDDGAVAVAQATPGGSGRVGRVHYALDHKEEPHYWLVLTFIRYEFQQPWPPGRLWHIIGESPIPERAALMRTPWRGARVYCIDRSLPGPDAPNDYRNTHCLMRTWRVEKGYDELKAMALPSDKPKRLSWITSGLTRFEGHRYRMGFLEQLKQRVDFDLFGRDFTPIADKWDGLAPYRYSIAFENSLYDDYFTEKVADPIMAGALPIYFGCPNLERYLPAGSFLRFDPEDSLVFERIADWTASDLWRERRPALEEAKALLLERYNTFRFLAGEFEADFPRTFGRR